MVTGLLAGRGGHDQSPAEGRWKVPRAAKSLVTLHPLLHVMQPVPARVLPKADGLPGGVQFSVKLDGIRAVCFIGPGHPPAAGDLMDTVRVLSAVNRIGLVLSMIERFADHHSAEDVVQAVLELRAGNEEAFSQNLTRAFGRRRSPDDVLAAVESLTRLRHQAPAVAMIQQLEFRTAEDAIGIAKWLRSSPLVREVDQAVARMVAKRGTRAALSMVEALKLAGLADAAREALELIRAQQYGIGTEPE